MGASTKEPSPRGPTSKDKSKKTQLVVSQMLKKIDSPAENTHRASRKRYYDEVDHDEASEEENKTEESSTSSTSNDNMILFHGLPKEGLEHQMKLWLRKNQKKLKLVNVQEDTEDKLDEDYLYKGYAKADLDLDADSYLEVDKKRC